ncbi:hypothetical protein [Consotaella salsifontis]|nr:hypothetical protein [Consotaella salsifontis]
MRRIAFPMAMAPEPTGTYPVGRETLQLAIGGRSTTIDLWYPAASGPDAARRRWRALADFVLRPTSARAPAVAPAREEHGHWPLLVYNPSWFSERSDNSFTLANITSHGFMVAALDDVVHDAPANDREAQTASLDFSSDAAFEQSRLVADRRVTMAAKRSSSVIDALAALPPWNEMIDFRHIGAIGFSFGGAVAAELGRSDARIRAVINMDGATFAEAARYGLNVPYLFLSSGELFPSRSALDSEDPATRFAARVSLIEARRQVERSNRPGYLSLVLPIATHLDFCDRLVMPPFEALREARTIDRIKLWHELNSVLIDFLDRSVRDRADPSAPMHWSPDFQSIKQARLASIPTEATTP